MPAIEPESERSFGALTGLRVLELGHALAGPFGGYLLAGFGADVIKIEPPGTGDLIRKWRMMHGDTSYWWYSLARNKKSITVNLRTDAGRDLVKAFVKSGVDVLIENFKPGKMESWGLGYDVLSALSPKLIMARVSGYGQTGPSASKPGFANVAEAVAGLRYLTGEPGRPPVRSGVSVGDTMSGMHAAFGVLAALYARERTGRGQVVDVALNESILNHMESLMPEYDATGHVRERCGARLEGIVPSNTYRCGDGSFVAIGGNSNPIFKRLMRLIGRPDLANDPELQDNDGRVPRVDELDAAIEAWTSQHTKAEVVAAVEAADVPGGPINDARDLATDPQLNARGAFDTVKLPGGESLKITGVFPRLSDTPGETRWPGPELGAHTDEVLTEVLGLSAEDIAELRKNGDV